MAYALIPAILKVRLRVNEILVSLMLVYVADLLLDYLVRGPWRDPQGFNMPQTVTFAPEATLPLLFEGGRMNLGSVIALIVVAVAAVVMARTLKGFEIRLVGEAPRAARFAGFSDARLTLSVFAVSGALAGLAGVMEASGTVRQLLPGFSPGYGFTAIIVAFLGRLNPVGCLVAGIFIAITFIGGENAQIMLRLPRDMTLVFQGLLLFYILACDTLILYRLRPAPRKAEA
jgi:simple sugar transport system permease protein